MYEHHSPTAESRGGAARRAPRPPHAVCETGGPEARRELDLREHCVLVVGGAGYVGSVMAGRLLRHGARVRVLDALVYRNGFALRHLLEEPKFSFIKGDFVDPPTVKGALEGVSDVILLASLVGDPICKRYPDLAVQANVNASKQLFDMLEATPVERFVFASTCSNYGIHLGNEPAPEGAPLNPQSLYAETKIEVENFILQRAHSVAFAPTVLRIATAYGMSPRMRFDLTVSHFTWALAAGVGLTVYDADTWRPYCHVRDISKAFMSVLCQDRERVRGEVYNVGENQQQFTKRMIVDEARRHLERVDVRYMSGDTDPRNYRVCFDKISRELGFACDHSVQDYVPRLIEARRQGAFSSSEVERAGNYELSAIA